MTELEPVAWTSAAQLQRMKEQPSQNHRMWGEPLPYHDDIPLVTLSSAQSAIAERDARIAVLSEAIEQLHGPLSVAALVARAEAAEAMLKEAGKVLEPFAKAAVDAGTYYHDTTQVSKLSHVGVLLTLGHLRAARSIAAKIGGKDE